MNARTRTVGLLAGWMLAGWMLAAGWTWPAGVAADGPGTDQAQAPATDPTPKTAPAPADGPTSQPADASAPVRSDPVAASAEAAGEPMLKASVWVCGIMVVAPPDAQRGRRVFRGQSGTRIAMIVEPCEGRLVGFDRASSKLTAFSDDAGQDLTREDLEAGLWGGFGGPFDWQRRNRFGEDEDGDWLVEVQVPRPPLPGTREVFVAGELVFEHCPGKPPVFRHDKVAAKPGARIDAGRIPMRISKVQADADDPSADGMELTLEMDGSDYAIKDVRFRDADGGAVSAQLCGSTMSTEGGRITRVEKTWRLNTRLDTVTVEVEYWSQSRTVKVPFALTVGLGMPAPPAPENQQRQ